MERLVVAQSPRPIERAAGASNGGDCGGMRFCKLMIFVGGKGVGRQ